MQHYYRNIHGWFTYPKLYSNVIAQAKDGFHIVEVGAWKGQSTAYMGVEIINSGKSIKFDTVDTWNGSEEHLDKSCKFYEPLLEVKDGLFNHFLQNIESIKHIVNPIRMPSVEAAVLYKDESLDFVFIDAAHDYVNVVNDIKEWLPKVKKRGVLSGHDFKHPPIHNAVFDTFGKNISSTSEDVWIYIK